MVKCDFSGYATRNDLLCGDGRTIRKDAFKENDGCEVPLVWNHEHNDPNAVLGHAILENRDDGVYAYGVFNDTEQGQTAKKLVQNGDVRSLSIWANQLKHIGKDVIHGNIRELSLVLAGANPGAYVDFIMAHSADGEEELEASSSGKKKLLGLFVNLADYQFGSTRGGEVTKFEDFDMDFNRYKYMLETRLSGALTQVCSAIALEEPVA